MSFIRRKIGQRIADAIQTSHYSIAQVAKRLRVREATVLRWRASENFPDLEHLLERSDPTECQPALAADGVRARGRTGWRVRASFEVWTLEREDAAWEAGLS